MIYSNILLIKQLEEKYYLNSNNNDNNDTNNYIIIFNYDDTFFKKFINLKFIESFIHLREKKTIVILKYNLSQSFQTVEKLFNFLIENMHINNLIYNNVKEKYHIIIKNNIIFNVKKYEDCTIVKFNDKIYKFPIIDDDIKLSYLLCYCILSDKH